MKTPVIFAFMLLVAASSGAAASSDDLWVLESFADMDRVIPYHMFLPIDDATIGFAQSKADQISAAGSQVPFWSTGQVRSLFTESPLVNHCRTQVMDWMETNQLTDDCQDWGDSFFCHSTAEKIESSFGVTLGVYAQKGFRYVRATTDFELGPVQECLELVEGFTHLPESGDHPFGSRRVRSVESTSGADPNYVGREVVDRLYNVTFDNVAKTVTSVGVVEFGGGGFSLNGVNRIQVDNGLASTNVSCVYGSNPGGGVESELDVQMVSMVADHVSLCFVNYQQGLWAAHMFSHLAQWDQTPSTISVSYGWAEWDQCAIISCTNVTASAYINRANVEALKLVLRGVSVMVSSGDAGSPGRTNEGCSNTAHPINPVYPGSSPYVTSVGATFVQASPAKKTNWTTEFCQKYGCAFGTTTQTVSQPLVGWTSGSGFSVYTSEPRTSWQADLVAAYLDSNVSLPNGTNWNRNGRAYPDVTDNGHNCPVWGVYGSGYADVDGTSCSSPLFAVKVALLDARQRSLGRRGLGFVNPTLYLLAQTESGVFSRPAVVTNSSCTEYSCCNANHGYQGGPADLLWNPVSGLGQINFGHAVSALDRLASRHE